MDAEMADGEKRKAFGGAADRAGVGCGDEVGELPEGEFTAGERPLEGGIDVDHAPTV